MSADRQGSSRAGDQRSSRGTSRTSLGAWMRNARFEQQLSQSELARRSGLSRSYLCNIEGGYDIHPSVRSLDAIAAALGARRPDVLAAAGILEAPEGAASDDDEQRFFAVYRSLSTEGQASVERFARFLQNEERHWNQRRLIDRSGSASQRGLQQGPTLFDIPEEDGEAEPDRTP